MILIKTPVLTEKTIDLYKNQNKVTFIVDLNANKINAAKAIEKAYDVTVESVTVSNRLGKTKKNLMNNLHARRVANRKIMVFKLKKGDKIDIFNK